MSEIERGFTEHSFGAGGMIDIIATDNLEYAIGIFDTFGRSRKAIGNALTRAAAAGKTAVKKQITQEYTISQSEFLAQTKNINHAYQYSSGDVNVVFGFRGYVIPLLRFKTGVNSEGRIVTQVKRSGAAETLNHAFVARFGGHSPRVYERVGKERFPVKQLYGPATPQMIGANEDVTDAMEKQVIETFEQRIDHEILRIMNGWGR